MKKILIGLTLLFICAFMCACTQSEPNIDRFITEPGGNPPAVSSSPGQENTAAPVVTPQMPAPDNTPVENKVFKTNYLGFGEVTYSFKSFELASKLPEGVNFASDKADNFLLVEIEVENNSVKENDAQRPALINCFNLYAENGGGTDFLSREPVYFSGHPKAEDSDFKNYFAYKLPAIGEKVSFVLGYELSDKAAEYLNSNKLFLNYTLSDKLIDIDFSSPKK